MLTDKYLDGIPEDSRAARAGSLSSRHAHRRDARRTIRALNEIAQQRGQTLAQMALAWTLRDPRVTSTADRRQQRRASSRTPSPPCTTWTSPTTSCSDRPARGRRRDQHLAAVELGLRVGLAARVCGASRRVLPHRGRGQPARVGAGRQLHGITVDTGSDPMQFGQKPKLSTSPILSPRSLAPPSAPTRSSPASPTARASTSAQASRATATRSPPSPRASPRTSPTWAASPSPAAAST